MRKKIVIRCCDDCFHIRNSAQEICYCIKAVLLKKREYSIKQEDLYKIPKWCPLPDDCSGFEKIWRKIWMKNEKKWVKEKGGLNA